jgi:hypothetical protein
MFLNAAKIDFQGCFQTATMPPILRMRHYIGGFKTNIENHKKLLSNAKK